MDDYICCACHKHFKTNNCLHGHKAKCEKYLSLRNGRLERHFTKKFLQWWFYKKDGSSNILAQLYNSKYKDDCITAGTIIRYCKKVSIKTPTIKEISNSNRIRLNRIGSNNTLAKGNKGYITRQTNLLAEGIVNVFQRPDVIEKIKATKLLNGTVITKHTNHGRMSKIHKCVSDFLCELGLIENADFYNEYVDCRFLAYNEIKKRDYNPIPDIFIPKLNMVLEIQGNLWHANPRIYDDDYLIQTWDGLLTAKEIQLRDEIKKKHYENLGYECIFIWEDEIEENKHKIICEEIFKKFKQKE